MTNLRWNYYLASQTEPGCVRVTPGEGGYEQGEIRAYLKRYILDNTPEMKPQDHARIIEHWDTECTGNHMSIVFPNDHLGRREMGCGQELAMMFLYPDTVDPYEAAWAHFSLYSSSFRDRLCLPDKIRAVLHDPRQEEAEVLGTIEMRISLLLAEAGAPRRAPVLWPTEADLLSRYEAVEENLDDVMAVALSPDVTEEVRHEACYLTYQITGLLRMDLYSKAVDSGVPARGNPDISWTLKTSPSKEW